MPSARIALLERALKASPNYVAAHWRSRASRTCHNLVVADYNAYFVTDAQVLVHDINVRGRTTVTVPGLVK